MRYIFPVFGPRVYVCFPFNGVGLNYSFNCYENGVRSQVFQPFPAAVQHIKTPGLRGSRAGGRVPWYVFGGKPYHEGDCESLFRSGVLFGFILFVFLILFIFLCLFLHRGFALFVFGFDFFLAQCAIAVFVDCFKARGVMGLKFLQ